MEYKTECKRCRNNIGTRSSHFEIDIFIQNDWDLKFCSKHKNFTPNQLIIWIDSKYHLYYKYPKSYMRIHNITYREARLKYYRFKYSQYKRLGG